MLGNFANDVSNKFNVPNTKVAYAFPLRCYNEKLPLVVVGAPLELTIIKRMKRVNKLKRRTASN